MKGAASCLGLCLGLVLIGCGGKEAEGDAAASVPQVEYDGPPILVIGVDGLEWSVLRPLMESGRAPNLAALMDRGTGGFLETYRPTWSPVVWTSIATGVEPETHGILGFAEMEEGQEKPSYDGLPYTSNCRKVPALWNIADDAGVSVLSVAWWISWPAEALRHGRVVASYAAQVQGEILWKAGVWEDGLPELTWPPALLNEIRPALKDGAPTGPLTPEYDARFQTVPADWGKIKEWEALFRSAYRGDATHVRIMAEQLRKHPAALNMVYVGLTDVAGHFFWRYHEPEAYEYEIGEDRLSVLGEHVNLSYEVVDKWVGELVAAAPPDARVLVVSDHGMHAGVTDKRKAKQSGGHDDAPPGVIIAAGPDIARNGFVGRNGPGKGPLGSVFDVTPTLLNWLGLPVAPDMLGEPMRKIMAEGWFAEHPTEYRDESYGVGFREATEPRVPTEDANEIFKDRILNDLGYAGDLFDEDDEEEAAPPAAGNR